MKLIINADDFGISEGTNKAIIELAKLQTISSTTVMVNMPYADDIAYASNIKNFGIGLHLNLTQGKSVLPACKNNSITDRDGNFYDIHEFKYRIKNKLIDKNDVLKELIAQYNKLNDIVGNNITHIDSHQDINKINLINKTLLYFIKTANIKTGLRWYNKSYLIQKNDSFMIINPSIQNISMFSIKRVLTETYFRFKKKELEKHFYMSSSMLYPINNSIRHLLSQLIRLEQYYDNDNIYEIMCHPSTTAYGLGPIENAESRIEEYNILKSPDFQKFISKNSLLSFSNLNYFNNIKY